MLLDGNFGERWINNTLVASYDPRISVRDIVSILSVYTHSIASVQVACIRITIVIDIGTVLVPSEISVVARFSATCFQGVA